jgi:NAD(P)H dehydrogenase (quinone)
MQILVLYHSRTGNIQKLAEKIAEGVNSVDSFHALVKTPLDVTREDFLQSEGLIIGSPVYFGTMAAELKKVLDDFVDIRPKMENKLGAAFASSYHPTGGKETTILSILQAMLIYGMIVIGDPIKAGGHYGVASSGTPTASDLEDAFQLGQRLASLADTFSAGKGDFKN